MKEQQERSRGAAGNDEVKTSIYKDLNQRDGITEFVGYQDETTLLESLPESWRTMPQAGDSYLVTKTPSARSYTSMRKCHTEKAKRWSLS